MDAGRIRMITAGVILVNFLAALEATVVSTAAPSIVSELGGFALYAWLFTAYMVALTVSGPIWGKLSDLYGRRGCYLLAAVIFMVGSALAGQARGMHELIAWRALQGIGGGALTPLGQTVLAEIYSLEMRAKMQALITTVFGIASVVGPAVGGVLTQHLSWRWVFYLNIPFGTVGVILLALSMPPDPARRGARLDRLGAVLFTAALTLLLLWSDGVDSWGLSDKTWGGAILIAALLAAFIAVERRRGDDALIPFSLFRTPTFTAAVAVMSLVGMGLYGMLAYLPLYFQGIQHESATQAGQSLTPLLATWVLSSAISTRLLLVVGCRVTVGIGAAALAGGFLIMTAGSAPLLAATLAGIGGGFCLAPLVLGVQAVMDRGVLGIATSTVLFFRSVGASLGVTLMGAALAAGVGGESQQRLLSVAALQPVLARGLHDAFLMGFALSAAAVVAACFIPSGVGRVPGAALWSLPHLSIPHPKEPR